MWRWVRAVDGRAPLPALRDADLLVTASTDIPSVLGVSLAEEYVRLREAFGFDDTVLAEPQRVCGSASVAREASGPNR